MTFKLRGEPRFLKVPLYTALHSCQRCSERSNSTEYIDKTQDAKNDIRDCCYGLEGFFRQLIAYELPKDQPQRIGKRHCQSCT